MSTLRLTCGLVVGTPVRYANRDWVVSGGPIGDNHLPEMLDFVYLERDRTPAGLTVMGVRVADPELLDDEAQSVPRGTDKVGGPDGG